MKLINCTLGFLPINVFLRNQWLQSLSQKPLNQMERNIKERLFSNHQHFG
jgi:regulatory protein YycI of two-component signal transduction system YycFG